MPDALKNPQPTPTIYPEATHGRLQNSSEPRPDEQRIISANIDGSPEYEAFKQNVREAKSVQMEDNLFGRIVFFTIGLFALAFADRLYGVFLPVIGWILKGVGAIFLGFLLYYVIRQTQISLASRKYKKLQKRRSEAELRKIREQERQREQTEPKEPKN